MTVPTTQPITPIPATTSTLHRPLPEAFAVLAMEYCTRNMLDPNGFQVNCRMVETVETGALQIIHTITRGDLVLDFEFRNDGQNNCAFIVPPDVVDVIVPEVVVVN